MAHSELHFSKREDTILKALINGDNSAYGIWKDSGGKIPQPSIVLYSKRLEKKGVIEVQEMNAKKRGVKKKVFKLTNEGLLRYLISHTSGGPFPHTDLSKKEIEKIVPRLEQMCEADEPGLRYLCDNYPEIIVNDPYLIMSYPRSVPNVLFQRYLLSDGDDEYQTKKKLMEALKLEPGVRKELIQEFLDEIEQIQSHIEYIKKIEGKK